MQRNPTQGKTIQTHATESEIIQRKAQPCKAAAKQKNINWFLSIMARANDDGK